MAPKSTRPKMRKAPAARPEITQFEAALSEAALSEAALSKAAQPKAAASKTGVGFSPYTVYSRADWARLREDTPLTLSEADLENLSGVTERISTDEVVEVYLPLSRLLNLYVEASQDLHGVTEKFLGKGNGKVPFVIGLAGSVAAGKSTSARVLQALLARWPSHPNVALVPTDGFLFSNAILEQRGLMERKGFPESYNLPHLLNFLGEVKSGARSLAAPVYSHIVYDVLKGHELLVESPDIVIVEGLNVLQPAVLPKDGKAIPFVSDFFDFSIYIDASEAHVEHWYVERFLRLRQTAFRDPAAYFHRFASFSENEARKTALSLWRSINLVNLRSNILPTRQRADLILRKGEGHAVESVSLRKL